MEPLTYYPGKTSVEDAVASVVRTCADFEGDVRGSRRPLLRYLQAVRRVLPRADYNRATLPLRAAEAFLGLLEAIEGPAGAGRDAAVARSTLELLGRRAPKLGEDDEYDQCSRLNSRFQSMAAELYPGDEIAAVTRTSAGLVLWTDAGEAAAVQLLDLAADVHYGRRAGIVEGAEEGEA